ncbi:hypothetical protein JTE90_018065 [Oedothorax gibbosus]|uniref:Protein amnionless n=1 Tax=Oedothorax gibbosus TaxID=931172 RepID=A0AAV6UBY3_9ARAC|nr:hypothetical protein JTE90_018065 [Oedothorax gibbosus]
MILKGFLIFVSIGVHYRVQGSISSDTKTWVKYTNFDNSRNWEGGRLPCKNDRVIFPASNAFAVFMPDSYSVAEMVLPLNGEFIFPDNATFVINGRGSPEGSCVGENIQFNPRIDSWYDPKSWNITMSDRAIPTHSSAVPHSFRVPCRTDKVRFPPKTTFKVHSMKPVPRVASLRINDLDYTYEEFQALTNTHTGKLLFPDNPTIRIESSPCADTTGCLCGNLEPEVLSTICKYEYPCPKLECTDPIQITGHCCPRCAAKLILDYESHFQMQQIINLIGKVQNTEPFRSVESFTSKIADGQVQSIFVDSKANKIANRMAQLLYGAINEDSDNTYGVRSIRIQKSVKWFAIPGSDNTEGISSGGIAAIVILIIIGSGMVAVFYIYKKRQIPGFSFARFDLRSDKIELELGTTPHDELEPGDVTTPPEAEGSTGNKAFDNPVYGTDISSEPTAPLEDTPEVRDFVENPMFTIFEDSPKN